MAQKRRIDGAIIQGGRMYRAGDEDAFAKVVTDEGRKRLAGSGALSGDWAGSAASEEAAPASAPAQETEQAQEPAATEAPRPAAPAKRGARTNRRK